MVVKSRFFERHQVLAGVQKRKAPGAIGRFEHARLETGIADGRRPAGSAGDAQGSGSRRRTAISRSRRKSAAQLLDLRQHVGRDPQDLGSSGSHSSVEMLNISVREALGGVGDEGLAAGQPPDQEGVDGAEAQLTPRRPRPGALDVWRASTDSFGAEKKIGIEQAGLSCGVKGLSRSCRLSFSQ